MARFGTSGLRGLARDLEAGIAYRYALAFLSFARSRADLCDGTDLVLGRDLRESSPLLMAHCAHAAREAGLTPIDCGALPTPALALEATRRRALGIMVTGSHIPARYNGLKFYWPWGEITKEDEAGITAETEALMAVDGPSTPGASPRSDKGAALRHYLARYQGLFPSDLLQGLRIGVYRHSSVGADSLTDVLSGHGADIVPLGSSTAFIAVDTEALDPGILGQLADWVRLHRLDALVSTDGDADRPLVIDETGRQVRGDALGLMTALELDAGILVTPVTSNSGLEAAAPCPVLRTAVGSPFVLATMAEARTPDGPIVGFEANGGMMLGSDATLPGGRLAALPTRDSLLPILLVLARRARTNRPLSDVVAALGLRSAASDRIEDVPQAWSRDLIAGLATVEACQTFIGDPGLGDPGLGDPGLGDPGLGNPGLGNPGTVERIASIDGIQMFLSDHAMLHVRPSGNAPELRCYAESDSPEASRALLEAGLERLRQWLASRKDDETARTAAPSPHSPLQKDETT